jgi:rhodanese-related sulfurtransferase
MKTFLSFFLVAFTIACFSKQSNSQTGSLSVVAFEKKFADAETQILDVRTAGEYQSGHLKNALQADWLNKTQFADRTQYLDKNKPVLVYCASGVRSGQAMQLMAQQGFKQVYNLEGGMSAWKMDGKSIESVNSPTELSIPAFQAMVNKSKITLVDIGADWCPPCKKMEPVLQQLKKDLGETYSLVKVDGGNDISVMKVLQFVALPTFIVFKDGKEVWRKQGIASLEELKAGIAK